jgi:hypothetical protein
MPNSPRTSVVDSITGQSDWDPIKIATQLMFAPYVPKRAEYTDLVDWRQMKLASRAADTLFVQI